MKNLSTVHAGITSAQLALQSGRFESLRKRLDDAVEEYSYKTPYSFLSSCTDTELLVKLRALHKEKNTETLHTVFVVGIGGANLGAKAIIDTLPYAEQTRKFVFLDTLYRGENEELISMARQFSSQDEFVVIVISKSGKTLETLASCQLLIGTLEEKLGSISKRIIAITTNSSPLYTWATHGGVSVVTIPQSISDRYSVFSPVAIMPLLFSSFDIDSFLQSAVQTLDAHISTSMGPAFQAACALDIQTPSGTHGILDLFYFSEKLETVGKWARQLLAESLGKESTVTGIPLDKSLTPTVSIGTTDLHSMLQLYLAQPKGRMTWFTTLSKYSGHSIGLPHELKELLPGIDIEAPEQLLSVVYENIAKIYEKQQMPYIQTEMNDLTAEDLGYYMMTTILVTLGLAELWNIDPWNQPNVEEYKDMVRKELLNNG